MNEDGSIVIGVEIDDAAAQKQLNSLTKKINGMEKSLSAMQSKRNPLAEQASQYGAELDAAKQKLEALKREQAKIDADLTSGTPAQFIEAYGRKGEIDAQTSAQEKAVDDLQKKWDSVVSKVEQYDEKIKATSADLERSKEAAGGLSKRLLSASGNGDKMAKATERAHKSTVHWGRRFREIVLSVAIFTVARKGLQSFISYIGRGLMASDSFRASLASLKGSLASAFQPIFTAIAPAIQTLINYLSTALSYVSAFISMLFGTTLSESKKAAEGLNEQAGALGGVGGAAEEASKQLAAFDEINKLEAPSSGGGGGVGGVSAEPGMNFEMSETDLAAERWAESLRVKLLPIIETLKENFDSIKTLVLAIGGGLLAWAISKKLISALGGVDSKLGKIATSLIVAVTGYAIEAQGFYEIGRGSTSLLSYLKAALGAALGVGAGVIGLTAAGLSAGAAFAITLPIALIVALTGLQLGMDQAKIDRFYETELGQSVQSSLDAAAEIHQANIDVQAHIDNVRAVLDEESNVELGTARQLINEIFDFSESENHTAAEIEVIKSKIEALNGMNLDGIHLEYDEFGRVVGTTRTELLGVVDALQQQYRTEALAEAYKQGIVAQYEAMENMKGATEQAKIASDNYNTALQTRDSLLAEEKELSKAYSEDMAAYRKHYEETGTELFNLNEKQSEYNQKLATVREELEKMEIAVSETQKVYSELTTELSTAVTNYQEATTEIGNVDAAMRDLATTTSNTSKTISEDGANSIKGFENGIREGSASAADAMTEAMKLINQAEKDFNGINSPSKKYEQEAKYVMEGFANGITNNADLVVSAMTGMLNRLLEKVEQFSNNCRSALSNLLSSYANSMASLSVSAKGKVSYTPISYTSVPRLATGAVIPPNREFMAVLGDQKRGNNIEAPEGLIRDIVRSELSAANVSGGDITIRFEGNLAQLGRVLQPVIEQEGRRRGTRLAGAY